MRARVELEIRHSLYFNEMMAIKALTENLARVFIFNK